MNGASARGFSVPAWGERGALLGLFVLALALRLANAACGSLWLDDFHSLHHARAADLEAFFGGLLRDNHPPLSFLLVRASMAAFGDATWALRLPALLAGLATFVLVWRMGARLACAPARAAAVALLALSTLHIEVSSDVRMYALLALANAGLLEGLLASFEEGRGRWRITLWTAVGLHTHYHFLHTLAALGAASVLLAIAHPRYRSALRPSLLAFVTAGFLSGPWYLFGFPGQLEHGLAPGGSNASVMRLLEGFKNLVFLNVSVSGEALRWLGLAASALLLVLALLGAAQLLGRARTEDRTALAWLCLASAFLVPLLSWGAAHVTTRAGFDWRYLSGAIPAFCLVVGTEACASGRFSRWRRASLWATVLAALAVALPNARDPGREDYRGATAWILERASSADAVVAADWQPAIFPHALAWEYYAPRLAHGRPLPARLEYTDELALADPSELDARPRVFCCLRNLSNECGILQTLRQHYASEEKLPFGRGVWVHLFTRS